MLMVSQLFLAGLFLVAATLSWWSIIWLHGFNCPNFIHQFLKFSCVPTWNEQSKESELVFFPFWERMAFEKCDCCLQWASGELQFRLLVSMVSLSLILKMFDQKDFSLVSNRFYTVTVTGLDVEKIPHVRMSFLGRQSCRGCAGTQGGCVWVGELTDRPALHLTAGFYPSIAVRPEMSPCLL